jgi:integrase
MGLYKRKNTQFYWMSYKVNGKRFYESTGTTNKKLAERIYAKVVLDVQEGRWFRIEAQRRTFEELRERYMTDYSIPNKAPRTVEKDLNTFKPLSRFFSGFTLAEITPQAVSDYKRHRRSQGKKVGTVAKELELLRASLNVAMREWEWIDVNPFLRVRIEQPKSQSYRWLTGDEEEALLSECPEWVKRIVTIALNTGMRQDEILSLKWRDVDLGRQLLTVVKAKNYHQRTIPLNQSVLEVFKATGKVRHISGLVFASQAGSKLLASNLRRAFNLSRDKSKIEHVRFHDLRHTFATRLVQRGIDLYVVKELLGHKSIKMTMRYAHHYPESLRHGVDILDESGDILVTVAQKRGHA